MLTYLQAWSIIKRKQILNFISANSKSFTKFAIVCAPRCGSTWLHTLLNSHFQIVSYGEIVREAHAAKPGKPLAALDELVFHAHHSSIQAVGLKIFYEYEDEPDFKKQFREVVDDNTIHIIHLTREDKEAQFQSLKRALATQQWSAGRRISQDPPVAIDSDELRKYQSNLIVKEGYIDELFQHHLLIKVKYEDLLSNHEVVMTTIQHFLNVSRRHLFSVLKKQS